MGLFLFAIIAIGGWLFIKAILGGGVKPSPATRVVEEYSPKPTGSFAPRRGLITLNLPEPRLAPMSPAPTPPSTPQNVIENTRDLKGELATPEVVAQPPTGADAAWMADYGISLVDGRYHAGRYGFSTLGQAVDYARRLGHTAAHPSPFEKGPSEITNAAAEVVVAAPSPNAADFAWMAEFGITFSAGRYHSHGYAFASLGQAVNYARRLQGTTLALPRREAARPVAVLNGSAPPSAAPRWFAFGQGVDVAGLWICDGLIYVGNPQRDGAMAGEKSLIDPSLPVAAQSTDRSGVSLSYWPSFSDLSPGSRRSYLEWLAEGRSDPEAGIGYVFIFFYGLERRLLIDKAFGEADAIIDEVQRLLTIYGANHSFQNYAARLISTAELVRETEITRPTISPDLRYVEWEIPLSVRRYLGAKLVAGNPFDADDALLWLVSLPDTSLRTPGTRCFEELTELWRIRYAQRHPAGLKVRAPKARLKAAYRSASGIFELSIDVGDLPDIAAVSAPIAGLRDLLDGCITDLDTYSRLIGRRPEARGALEGSLCLPTELRDSRFAIGVAKVREAIENLIGDAPIVLVSVRSLCEIIGVELAEPKIGVAMQRHIANILDRLDVAYEPDRRYGDVSLAPDGNMMIYRAAQSAPVDPEKTAYVAARAMVEIAALAATADGEVVAAEVDSIRADLHATDGLTDGDRARLLAHAHWLLSDPPRQQAALKRLGKLSLKERQSVTQAAISAVLADGHVQPAEVRFLEKLYATLGLPVDQVYATLHRGSVQIDEPVVVASETWAPGVAIPAEKPAALAVNIDAARLARVRLETSEVSSLLAGIFAEDEPLPIASPLPVDSDGLSDFKGLDANHAKLLNAMMAAGAMDRAVFEQHAKALRLLPDGAIETINDWAFDTFDEQLLEGDEQLFLSEHLREPLHAMGNVR